MGCLRRTGAGRGGEGGLSILRWHIGPARTWPHGEGRGRPTETVRQSPKSGCATATAETQRQNAKTKRLGPPFRSLVERGPGDRLQVSETFECSFSTKPRVETGAEAPDRGRLTTLDLAIIYSWTSPSPTRARGRRCRPRLHPPRLLVSPQSCVRPRRWLSMIRWPQQWGVPSALLSSSVTARCAIHWLVTFACYAVIATGIPSRWTITRSLPPRVLPTWRRCSASPPSWGTPAWWSAPCS